MFLCNAAVLCHAAEQDATTEQAVCFINVCKWHPDCQQADLTLPAKIAEQVQGLGVVRHDDNAVIGFCPQHSQHARHEGKLARQELPALGQAPPANSTIVKQPRWEELAAPL